MPCNKPECTTQGLQPCVYASSILEMHYITGLDSNDSEKIRGKKVLSVSLENGTIY
jgi:hypothetical protein